MLRIVARIISFCLATAMLSFAFSQTRNSEGVVVNFDELLSSSKELLSQLSLEVEAYEQWFKSYQSQVLLTNGGILEDDLNLQLVEVWGEIERLEQLTKTGWLDSLSGQLDSLITAEVSANEISSWISSQKLYIEKIQEDVAALGRNVENIKQTYPSAVPNHVTDNTVTSVVPNKDPEEIVSDDNVEELPVDVLEHIYTLEKADEYDALEASLLFLLGGLEMWGRWLEPTNEIGLLPEAEGRFMTSSTPILQAGSTSIPGGIGVVGFAQPILISHGGAPAGFTEEASEPLAIDYDDSIEDVFQKVPYHDRLVYQYGVQINGRNVRIYRRPIETELTLATALQRMGAPPDVAELWVEEYAEIAFLPHTIQLSWLIAGNPLAKDYKLHTENLLSTFNLNTLFIPEGKLTSPQTPSPEWVSEDPFWEELQNQPFLKAFADLLNGASEEIQRSFIVSLFFVEPSLPIVRSASKNNINKGASVRSKPFFWEDGNSNNGLTATAPPPAGSADPAQEPLVKRALQQRTNLIHYWTPRQGDIIIPWENRNLLSPDKGNPYFIMAVTALPQFTPIAEEDDPSNYPLIVREIVSNHLPKNQPVFKVFLGNKEIDRKLVTEKGTQLAFTDTSLIWSADSLDNDSIVQHAKDYYESNRTSPYTTIKLDNGPYLAGSLLQLKRLLQNKQDFTIETIIARYKSTSDYVVKQPDSEFLKFHETWLQLATRVSANTFDWLPQRQNELLIQSTHRKAIFQRKPHLTPKIEAASMVQWATLPANETLLKVSAQWYSDVFLVQVEEGYFPVTVEELNHLQNYADQTPKVHSLILAAESTLNPEQVNTSVRSILGPKNINCDSLRVLSAGGVDLAYSRECSLIITESGKELTRANAKTLLHSTKEGGQPIAIFRPPDKTASSVPLSALVDANADDTKGLSVGTLVPVYNLEGLDEEEKEAAIELNIADALKQALQFFPEQNKFEILLPEKALPVGQEFSYTNNMPANFEAIYNFDEIKILTPSEKEEVTFYRVGGSVDIKLSANDVYIQSSGELNKGHILELAQKFHEKNTTHYTVIKSTQGNYYGGSLNSLSNGLPMQEYPENLLLMVTKVQGINSRGFGKQGSKYTGWLQLSAENVVEYAEKLGTKPNDTVNVWSAAGHRYAAFTAEGELQLEPTIQWTERPSNQLLQSLRKTWEGHIMLVNVPSKGYFLAQTSDGEFIRSINKGAIPEAQIESIILASDSKNFSRVTTQVKSVLSTLQVTSPVRILSSASTPTVENQSVYNGLDLALKMDNQGEPTIDLQLSGLELAENPRQWLGYTEFTSSPLAIFEWPDGKRSSALLIHIQRVVQDITELRSHQIVPIYNLEELENTADPEEKESIITASLQDTLQRALNFLPGQTSFQVVMPDGKTSRHYSQNPPTENRVQSEPLGIIEVTRQSDNTKIKYYYHPESGEAIAQSNDTDITQTLALLARETGFENTQYQGTRPPNLEELAEKSQVLFNEVPKELIRIYAVLKVGDQAYFGGPWHKIREITGLNNVTVDTVAVSSGVNFFVGKNKDDLLENRNWLSDWAGKTARDVFATFPQNSFLTVCDRSCSRKVVFKRNGDSQSQNEYPEVIDLAAMPQIGSELQKTPEKTYIQWWDHLPSNAELLAERAKWQNNMMLMHAPALDRYFFIAQREISYFEKYTDQPVQVHTLVWMSETTARFSDFKVRLQEALSKLPKHVSKIRVVSAPNHEISFDRECKIDVFGSCVELLQQNPSEWLATTVRWYDMLVVFQDSSEKGEGRFSGVPFHMLLDTRLDELYAQGIAPHSLVPIYSDELLAEPTKALNDPDNREEVAFFVTEAIRRIYPIFPESQAIKILMPDGGFVEYTLEEKASIDESDPLSALSFTSSDGDTVRFYRV